MPKKILVVEDNKKNLKLIADILAYHGYEVIEAGDGAAGVKSAGERKPDLILMNFSMASMTALHKQKVKEPCRPRRP